MADSERRHPGADVLLCPRLAHEAITVNAISPALIATDMVVGKLQAFADRIPVGRLGQVEEAAQVATMLAENAFITG